MLSCYLFGVYRAFCLLICSLSLFNAESTPLSFVFSYCISDWLRRPSGCFALFKRLAGKIASYNLLSGTLNPSLIQEVTVSFCTDVKNWLCILVVLYV